MDLQQSVSDSPLPLLEVRNLETHLFPRRGLLKAVDNVSFTLESGETLGIVGESGSGKSMLAMSLMRLVPQPVAKIVGGEILLQGRDLLKLDSDQMRSVRGRDIGMILQDPHSSLNPVFSIGFQVDEAIKHNQEDDVGKGARGKLAIEALRTVRLPDPDRHLADYPHQLSGGMKQRVIGAMAIAGHPRVLIADEPTTALDLTIQAQYLDLLREMQEDSGVSMIIITHDFGVIAEMCDRVLVMYGGRVIESGPVEQIFDDPRHPYTKGLRECIPSVDKRVGRLPTIEGVPPDLAALPTGCTFEPRCRFRDDRCAEEYPDRFSPKPDHQVECWRLEDPTWTPH